MHYALDQNELQQLRNADWTAEFPGAEVLTTVFRTDEAILAQILPRPLQPTENPILGWDFDKIIIAHGDLIETNAKERAMAAWKKPLSAS